jgi:glucose uptake protein GlcU
MSDRKAVLNGRSQTIVIFVGITGVIILGYKSTQTSMNWIMKGV